MSSRDQRHRTPSGHFMATTLTERHPFEGGQSDQAFSFGKVKTVQGAAMPRKKCSPRGTSILVVSAATAPVTSTLRPSGRHRPSNRLTRLTAGAIAGADHRGGVPDSTP